VLAKVYQRAAELVQQGWWSGALLSDDETQVCLVQALWTASLEIRGRAMRPGELVPLTTALARRGWTGHASDWNDVPGRTQDEVEAALREAAGLVG